VRAARDAGCDFTADWTHLKLTGPSGATVALKDPFRAVDERVDALIAHAVRTGGTVE